MKTFDQQFAEAGLDQETTSSADPSERIVQSLSDSEIDDIDDELLEAERRLAKAAYYKVIVKNGVIEDNGSQEAAEINAESKLWARQMMVKLLKGERPEEQKPVQAQLPSVLANLTEKQAVALVKLADKAISMMGEPTVEPTVKKVQTAPTPMVKKVKTSAPAPVAKKPASAPAKPKPKAPPKAADGKPDYDSVPTGEVFRDVDGHHYKFVENRNYDPSAPLMDAAGKPNPYAKQRTKLKVTKQVQNNSGMPVLSREQLQSVTAAQSLDSVALGRNANEIFPDSQGGQDVFVMAAAAQLREDKE